ncbi:iron chaperone [Mucilaginibacter sp. UR6-11]|uniref:iron chaperone n=1 Tax=Mucilaginibacter sp. UR6-11 TaxID=1435644 RepID=UPI001E5ADF0D|nr:DUF1801 domain-containing protein [Mucilaginibacter sp. UR6-11]MCC8425406.1 DUF1801 domain-containing protein [Mucilaginibacter sp. UR6-11]
MKTDHAKNIDDYIAAYPADVQEQLQTIRAAIQQAAPNAREAIKYGIPTFTLNGNLVHFGGYKNHIGFYPAPMGIEAFKEETAKYEAGKGTLQFPLDQPLPLDLITRIVKFRVDKNLAKGKKG